MLRVPVRPVGSTTVDVTEYPRKYSDHSSGSPLGFLFHQASGKCVTVRPAPDVSISCQ